MSTGPRQTAKFHSQPYTEQTFVTCGYIPSRGSGLLGQILTACPFPVSVDNVIQVKEYNSFELENCYVTTLDVRSWLSLWYSYDRGCAEKSSQQGSICPEQIIGATVKWGLYQLR